VRKMEIEMQIDGVGVGRKELFRDGLLKIGVDTALA
jgi:hypothetical protein